MVARLEALGGEVARLAHLLENDVVVLAAGGHLGLDEVVEPQHELVVRPGGVVLVGLGGLDLGGQLLGPGEQRLLVVALRPRDLLAQRLLLGPELLERRDRGAAPLLGGEHLVDELDGGAAAALALAYAVRIFTQNLGVDHGTEGNREDRLVRHRFAAGRGGNRGDDHSGRFPVTWVCRRRTSWSPTDPPPEGLLPEGRHAYRERGSRRLRGRERRRRSSTPVGDPRRVPLGDPRRVPLGVPLSRPEGSVAGRAGCPAVGGRRAPRRPRVRPRRGPRDDRLGAPRPARPLGRD